MYSIEKPPNFKTAQNRVKLTQNASKRQKTVQNSPKREKMKNEKAA